MYRQYKAAFAKMVFLFYINIIQWMLYRSNVRQQNDHNKTSPSYVVKTTGSGDQHVGRLITSQDSRRHQWNSKQQQQSRNYRKQTHPFLSQQQAQADVWKPHTTRDAMVIELDKRAKSMVEDAIMVSACLDVLS